VDFQLPALRTVQGLGNIGNPFLSQFFVTFDFPNATMYLDPISPDGTVGVPPVGEASVGWDGTQPIVGTLALGSAADTRRGNPTRSLGGNAHR
jgi:hypothetical protein